MSLHIGTDSVKGVYVGTDEVQKIYLGTDLVYSRGRRKTLLFSDTGVTGTANPNYTIIGGAIKTVEATGTKINSTTFGDGFAKVGNALTGDFEAEFTFVEGGNIYYPDIAFLDSSNAVQFSVDHRQEVGTENIGYTINCGGQQNVSLGPITNGEVWKITREGNKLSLLINDSVKMQFVGVPTTDVYFGWKTHSHASRWYRFRDLSIYKLEE